MKIDEQVLERIRWEARDDGATTVSVKADDLRSILSAYEAIEQHHKDLMGLVERWRDREAEFWKRKDDYSFGLHQAYGYAADDLESLINPKD